MRNEVTNPTAPPCWSHAEQPVNNLEAILSMVFDHVGQHIHKNTGDLLAMQVYQCLLMAMDQVGEIQGVLEALDIQFAYEDSERRPAQVVKVA